MKSRTYIIAEAGVNHNGSLETALELVDAAASSGADAVKFQTFRADSLASYSAPKAAYQKRATDDQESQLEMIRRLELSLDAHQALLQRCQERNIEFLSTPFDVSSLWLLTKQLGLQRIKLPSGEITNSPLLLSAGRTRCQLILSTGMCTLSDIEMALSVLAYGLVGESNQINANSFLETYSSEDGRAALANHVVLMHCVTEYPAPVREVNLRAIITLKAAFGLPVGYSDHTLGNAMPIAAVALGASVIEKHFTLSREMPGPDHIASSEPGELCAMVESIRQVEDALGSGLKVPTDAERPNMLIARRSLVALAPIQAGQAFSESNLGAKRPGGGVPPTEFWRYLGRFATRDYGPDEMIEW